MKTELKRGKDDKRHIFSTNVARVRRERNIITEYYNSKNGHPVWTNRSVWPRQASKNAQDYLHEDTHKAWIAVIYDQVTGQLYCIWRRDVNGDVHSMYRNDEFNPTILTDMPDEWFPTEKEKNDG